MTVTADNKRRVPLRMAAPGDRFDVQVSPEGKLVLTKLVPVTRPGKARFVKKNGYTVGIGPRKVSEAEIRKALEQFP